MNYRKLDPDELQVDIAYQRNTKRSSIRDIVANYDEEAFGVLVVGRRDDDSLWVVDGQNRLEAAKILSLKEVPCLVFPSSGRSHEAKVFKLLSNQRPQSLLDRTRAMLTAGDKDTLRFQRALQSEGFEIGFSNRTWPYIRSIQPLLDAFCQPNGHVIVKQTLQVIKRGFGFQDGSGPESALKSAITGGLCLFIRRHHEVMDEDVLVESLRKYTTEQLIAKCDSRRMQGGNRMAAMCKAMEDLYQMKASRKHKLRIAS